MSDRNLSGMDQCLFFIENQITCYVLALEGRFYNKHLKALHFVILCVINLIYLCRFIYRICYE